MAETKHEGLGVFSLRAMAAGFALPLLASIGLVLWRPDLAGQERYRAIVYLAILFGGLELVALLAGLAAWSTRAGKLGAVLALVLLLAGGGWIAARQLGYLECTWCEIGKPGHEHPPEHEPSGGPEMEPGGAPEMPGAPEDPGGGAGELFPDVPAGD